MKPISLTAMQQGHLLGLVNRELMQLNSGVGLSCDLCNFTGEVELPWWRCTHGRGPRLDCPSCGEPNRHWLRFGELEELYDRLSQTADTAEAHLADLNMRAAALGWESGEPDAQPMTPAEALAYLDAEHFNLRYYPEDRRCRAALVAALGLQVR